jgi:serine/threonine-protein kinase
MSYFHTPSHDQPLVFGGGQWTWDADGDGHCPDGAPTHIKQSAQFPLPQSIANPIPALTGHGHTEQTGSCPLNTDITQTFTRTGD